MIGTVARAERIEAVETRLSLAMLDVTRRQADVSACAACQLAVVTVEPGSRSQANGRRRGFVPLYRRLVLARS